MDKHISIRLAVADDLESINDIYNHYVRVSTCTYQEEPERVDARRIWFVNHRPETHPVTVAVRDGKVVGWGSLSPYHSRCAYRYSVETSVYVQHNLHRQGIGSNILKDLIDRARAIGYHSMIAAIDGDQTGSIALHAGFGFTEVGHLHQVGFKFGRWLDVIYLERILS